MNTSQSSIYRHAEAFSLMEYASQDGKEVEFIWNSRDGVTPFMLLSRLGTELRHTNWQRDRCIPDFRPQPGSRIFVDMTPELARQYAERNVERAWDISPPLQETFTSREQAIAELAASYFTPGAPAIQVVPMSPESERTA